MGLGTGVILLHMLGLLFFNIHKFSLMLAFAIQEYIIYHILHIYLISVCRIQKWKLDTTKTTV